MAFRWIRNLISRKEEEPTGRSLPGSAPVSVAPRQTEEGPRDREIPRIPASDPSNPWGVELLDLRPISGTTLAASRDLAHIENLASLTSDDGRGFIDQPPIFDRELAASLRFPIDWYLADGVLFAPEEMEDKWAIYIHGDRMIFVRSWTRAVHVVAELVRSNTEIEIVKIRGAFTDAAEEQEWTIRMLDYLMRSHALDVPYPLPLPRELVGRSWDAALWSIGVAGRRALFAAEQPVPYATPEASLRTLSVLHIAVARKDGETVQRLLDAGMPFDLLATDGLTPLHWALATEGAEMIMLLLLRGCPVDVKSSEGVTALMSAVQMRSVVHAGLLLDRGANPNLGDFQGFTALHRAAELGDMDMVRLLLARGARPSLRSQHGYTARAMAEMHGNAAIAAIL